NMIILSCPCEHFLSYYITWILCKCTCLKETVTVRLEEGMVLDCLCPWDGNLSMVSWTKVPDKDPVAVFHPEYGVAFSHQYRERIEFLRTTPMDGSISMRNVTHQDIGLYHCSVQTFPQGPWTRNIQVEDLEVTVADTELVAEQNNNLTIRCNHQHSGTVYQVILEKMLHGEPWHIIGVCKKVEGGLVGEDYSDRGQVNCADNLDVSLHMTDVVQEDSGFYRCTFNTDAGVKTTSVQLTVTTPGITTDTSAALTMFKDGRRLEAEIGLQELLDTNSKSIFSIS
uniref:CD226 molecule n=1 Tax=Amphiprion percula TaxID=161767 RepID=A0A3P8U3R1_AMPPE